LLSLHNDKPRSHIRERPRRDADDFRKSFSPASCLRPFELSRSPAYLYQIVPYQAAYPRSFEKPLERQRADDAID